MTLQFSRGSWRLACAAALLLSAGGCGMVEYGLHALQGQLQVQGNLESIDDVLASGRLSEEEAEKLRLIVKVREYAINEMGLNGARAYTLFYDTRGDPLAFNLTAARKDRLEPKIWEFPLLGRVPYLAFFDEGYLRRVEQQYIRAGYDTMTYELDAYATLGLFDDPVRSTMLRRDTLSLSETIIHELLHNTVWRPNDAVFSESLATYVGRQGALEFLAAHFGANSGWPDLALKTYADRTVVNDFLLRLYTDLEAYYAQPLDSAVKVTGREEVFAAARARFAAEVQPTLNYPSTYEYLTQLPTNNAWVLANYRYNLDLGVFADVYIKSDRNWRAALSVFAQAAATDDPFAYLRDWLARQS